VVLGEISFGIYLIHGVVLYCLFTFVLGRGAPGMAPYVGLVLSAITVVLIGAAAHLVIERPAITLGRILSGGRRPPQRDGVGLSTADVAP
jgi:peptidoglycan/LPS O-acetylase OafA/YrhL